MREAWDLGPFTAVHMPRHTSPQATKNREIHNCMHEQLGQIQDPKYTRLKNPTATFEELGAKTGPCTCPALSTTAGQAEHLSPTPRHTPPHIRSSVVPTLRSEWTREPVFLSWSPGCSRDPSKTLPKLLIWALVNF